MTASDTKGRAASWIATSSASSGRAKRPLYTESRRVAPPRATAFTSGKGPSWVESACQAASSASESTSAAPSKRPQFWKASRQRPSTERPSTL